MSIRKATWYFFKNVNVRVKRVDWNIPNDKSMKIEEEVILNMCKFDYVMIFTRYGKKITWQGAKWNLFLQNMVVKRLHPTGEIIT